MAISSGKDSTPSPSEASAVHEIQDMVFEGVGRILGLSALDLVTSHTCSMESLLYVCRISGLEVGLTVVIATS